jgi:hypothetical protein
MMPSHLPGGISEVWRNHARTMRARSSGMSATLLETRARMLEQHRDRPHHWPWDLEEVGTIWTSPRTGILIFHWKSQGSLEWDEEVRHQPGWTTIRRATDLPGEIPKDGFLLHRLGCLSYWHGTLRPAIFVWGGCTEMRNRLAAIVANGFDLWWQMHKGGRERTYWRQRAPPLPMKPLNSNSDSRGHPYVTLVKWKIKDRPRLFSPLGNGILDEVISWAILECLGLKGYRAVKATSGIAKGSIMRSIPQWRTLLRARRTRKEDLLHSLAGVLGSSSIARNLILEFAWGVPARTPATTLREVSLYPASRRLYGIRSLWRTQLWEYARLAAAGLPRGRFTGPEELMEHFGLQDEEK